MDPERWRRAFKVFQATITRDGEERAAFLADACLGDEWIRQAVEELVWAHESAGNFLEVPAVRALAADDQIPATAHPSDAVQARSEFVGTERFTVLRWGMVRAAKA